MKVKIKDIEIDIVEKENSKEVYINDSEWQIGVFSLVDCKIYLHRRIDKTLKYQALIHELAHAFIHIYNIDISDEENICDFMSIYCKDIINIADRYFKEIAGNEK